MNSFKPPQQFKVRGIAGSPDGAYVIPRPGSVSKVKIRVIAASALGWEHVSVSLSNDAMPTWNDMCYVKALFWEKEAVVVQFHPAESDYVNIHNSCLHLWRPISRDFPTPPKILV